MNNFILEQITFIVFPSKESVPQLMKKNIKFVSEYSNDDNSLISISKAASLSYNFLCIHPFNNGNGSLDCY